MAHLRTILAFATGRHVNDLLIEAISYARSIFLKVS